MELPFYFTLTDFQEKYKPDFINYSEMEQITLSEYYLKLQEKYTNALTRFKNALSDLQYLRKEIRQRTMEQLNYFYNNSDAPKTKVEKQIQLFNETYHLPEIDLLGINTPQLEKYLNSTIPEMQKIIDLIRFEIANMPKTSQSENLEPEPYKEKEIGVNIPYKLALLDEMGVIKNLNLKFTNKTDIHKILQFLTGGNIDNVKNYYNSIYGNYSGTNQITEKHRAKAKDLYYK